MRRNMTYRSEAQAPNVIRFHHLILYACSLCVAHAIAGISTPVYASPLATLHTNDKQSFVVGTMNGVPLNIPEEYLLEPVHYLSNSQNQNHDNEIAIFEIRVRLADFRPITTENDRKEWNFDMSRARPSYWENWLTVGFDNRHPVNKSINKNLPDGLRQDPAHWGPFILDKTKPYGLSHYASTQTIDSSQVHGRMEYFYDGQSLTQIVCETSRIKVAPFSTYDRCNHRFLIPQLNVMAEAIYAKKDLPRWKEIEQHVIEITNRFVKK
ncbi:hypothetical protein [Paraburkholderia heleia]|uniref:hypothetical protein n=1 Tax=Paraburkholderia heleia TaxID=634127 RepID=UPI002AB642D3|nr:hypothetical protein [Paraburkholderia heleia]